VAARRGADKVPAWLPSVYVIDVPAEVAVGAGDYSPCTVVRVGYDREVALQTGVLVAADPQRVAILGWTSISSLVSSASYRSAPRWTGALNSAMSTGTKVLWRRRSDSSSQRPGSAPGSWVKMRLGHSADTPKARDRPRASGPGCPQQDALSCGHQAGAAGPGDRPFGDVFACCPRPLRCRRSPACTYDPKAPRSSRSCEPSRRPEPPRVRWRLPTLRS
jgi:hypothetical protein